MSDQDRTADASNEDHYVWWVENSPTDHSHHVVHGTKSSIEALRQRVGELEQDRDEWRETARSEMAGRRAAEAAIASLEDNADVWEKRALAAEAQNLKNVRAYSEELEKRTVALRAEVARLTALLDVSERKLGEWRDRGAEMERLREAGGHLRGFAAGTDLGKAYIEAWDAALRGGRE